VTACPNAPLSVRGLPADCEQWVPDSLEIYREAGQVARSITHGAGQFTDRLLALCQGIKIAQMPIPITATYTVHSGANAFRLVGEARDVFAPMRNASYGPAHYLKHWVLLFAGISWCRFQSKHRAATIQMRVMKFITDEFLGGRAAGMALEPAGLLVEPPQSPKLFVAAELRLLHC
jgi:hypothetical protein